VKGVPQVHQKGDRGIRKDTKRGKRCLRRRVKRAAHSEKDPRGKKKNLKRTKGGGRHIIRNRHERKSASRRGREK